MFSETIKKLGRNAKVLIATEPFWSIPMSWIFFYRPIFLNVAIGLSSVEIGLLITAYYSLLTVMPLFGGYLADRFGRKRVFMLFDSICWLSSMAIWSASRNIWYVLLAYIIEGCSSTIYPVWECLLVEGTKPELRSMIYASVSATYAIGSLSAPVAGYIVGLYGLDAGCRLLFILAAISFIPMYIIRQIYLRETELGLKIMTDKTFSGFAGYLSSMSILKKDYVTLKLFIIIVLVAFFESSFPYFSLFLVHEKGLGLSKDISSIIPSAISVISLLVLLFVVSRLRTRNGYLKVLISGYSFGAVAMLLFVSSPSHSLPAAVLSGLMLGFYSSTAYSVTRTFITNQIEIVEERARAKILSMMVSTSSLINLPTPTIAGYLFSLDPKLPLITILGIFIVSIILLASLAPSLKKEPK